MTHQLTKNTCSLFGWSTCLCCRQQVISFSIITINLNDHILYAASVDALVHGNTLHSNLKHDKTLFCAAHIFSVWKKKYTSIIQHSKLKNVYFKGICWIFISPTIPNDGNRIHQLSNSHYERTGVCLRQASLKENSSSSLCHCKRPKL